MGDWTEEIEREERVYPPVHPGEILDEEFLKLLGMTAYQLAKAIGVMPPRVYEIVHGERAVSADTALRLGRYFGTGPEFLLNLQSHYDLEVARDRAGEKIEREVKPLSPAERS
jgi:addiction module HigA family antidote